MNDPMKDKVCVITGGTDGIGKAAAHALARQGARLLIHGRDPEKGNRAVAEITAHTKNPAVEFVRADFSSLEEVRQLAVTLMQRAPRIDVLINNAGGIFGKRTLSKDGYEMTFAVNHLAPFLLTHLLIDALKRGRSSRIVTTASNAHRGAKIVFDDLQATRKYSPMSAYGVSKLANILFTHALAKRLQGTTVTATSLHPGFCRTSFGREVEMAPLLRSLFGLAARFARSPEKGAETVVYLAASPQVEGASDGYYFDCKPIQPAQIAQDASISEQLWRVSEKLVGIAN
jgi:NAD(P)-dependent dehydrogenase (short-subunit alcohol dehydrogenase family)